MMCGIIILLLNIIDINIIVWKIINIINEILCVWSNEILKYDNVYCLLLLLNIIINYYCEDSIIIINDQYYYYY